MGALKVGDFATATRIYTAEDVRRFAELVNDFNPVHFDEEYAKKTIFGRPIVHGPFVITLITSIFASELPGPGCIYMSQEVRYIAPVYIGDEITARVELIEVTVKGHYVLKTECKNHAGVLVITGTAKAKVV